MKPIQTTKSILTALKSFTNKSLNVIIITTFLATGNNMYANEKPSETNNINTSLESVSLKGISDNQSDLLNWEVQHAESIAYFTIECAKSSDMEFNEVASVNPLECAEHSRSSSFSYKCSTNEEQEIAYYRVKVTFQDNHTIESNFISIKKTQSVANINISEIKNQGGQITLTFKSSRSQNVTLNILNKVGQLLAVKNIAATVGDNTYSYDASFINPSEMLIFSLNNQEEQITKKYMLASAW